MVALDEVAPACVSQLGHLLRRADDVGEEDGGEHPVKVSLLCTYTGEEALDLPDDRVAIGCPSEVVMTWQADESRAPNPRA